MPHFPLSSGRFDKSQSFTWAPFTNTVETRSSSETSSGMAVSNKFHLVPSTTDPYSHRGKTTRLPKGISFRKFHSFVRYLGKYVFEVRVSNCMMIIMVESHRNPKKRAETRLNHQPHQSERHWKWQRTSSQYFSWDKSGKCLFSHPLKVQNRCQS